MNYNYLRYFSVLAEVEHYTLAAARLGISQPSLSSAIRNLENDLGVKLFEKVGRNIQLTEHGRYFQKKVDAAMEELNNAAQTLSGSGGDAPVVLRLGYVSGTMEEVVPGQIAAYIREEKRAIFQLTEGSAENLMDLLRQEKLDMAIVDGTVRDRSLDFRKLRERDLCVALPQNHPLTRHEALKPRMLERYPQIGFSMDRSFEAWANREPRQEHFICQVNTAHAAIDLVSAGLGIAVLPEECILQHKGVVYRPLDGWRQTLYLCVLYDRWLEPPVWEFVERVVKAVRSTV